MSSFTLLQHEVHLGQHAILHCQVSLSEVLHPSACTNASTNSIADDKVKQALKSGYCWTLLASG